MTLKHFGAGLLLMVGTLTLQAQKTTVYLDKDALYKDGLELFDKKLYVAAQKSFIDYVESPKSSGLLKIDAEYYAAACAIELFHKDGEWRMREFIEHHPESPKVKEGWFYLGKSNFRKKKYEETIEFLEKMDIYALNKEELAEFYFKRGYSYFELKNYAKSKQDLYEIKDVDTKYSRPAAYYYAHIAYLEKNYEIALKGFTALRSDETFGPVVPYYITQIYFIQGKYNEVVKNAPALLSDSANVQKEGEINRMIGESYFNLKDYGNALTYLQKTKGALNAEGAYALGYCYYQTKDYTNATTYLERATESNDSLLAQNAWYHLADCHIKTNNKAKARNAYYSASNMNADKRIKEDALFSYAKLCYDLSFNPYNEAIAAFNTYIKNYPNTARRDEAYRFLVNVYSTTKNYKEAIGTIEKLKPMDPALKGVYEKLVYFRAVEFYNNNVPDSAATYFRKAQQIAADKNYNALSTYWLGEISYNKKDYTTAIDTWKEFQLMAGAVQLKEYTISNYNLGYAYFQRQEKEDYTNANLSFRKFLLNKAGMDARKIADATVRTADCYFMLHDCAQASDYYETAIAMNKMDVDYSIYQKALCDGLLKNHKEKINGLKQLETKYPKSNYLAASIFEIAETYEKGLNDGESAISYYNKVLKNYPNSSYVTPSLINIGQIYYNRRQDDKAFQYFDQVVQKDPKGPDANEVLPMIKKIFEGQGKIDEMEAYFAKVGNPLNTSQLESSLYESAKEAYYDQKNCDVAMPKFESYIKKFPSGKYITEAHFCYAECSYSKGLFAQALPSYQYIVQQPRSLFTETALVKASYLLYKDKNYQQALPLYQQLEDLAETPANKLSGSLGAMRSAFILNQFEVVLDEANKVLASDKLTPQQTSEAHYDKARSLFELGRLDDAFLEMKAIAKSAKNVTGAEALYYIAKINFLKKDYKEAEKGVNTLISYPYTNDDWNTKGMLLIADCYMAKGEDKDAEVILQTILDSKPKVEYVSEVKNRQNEIKARQEQRNQQQQQQNPDLKIEFKQQGNTNDKDLFDELYEQHQEKLKKEKEQQQQQPK